MEKKNCTPHEIRLNDGKVFKPSGCIPRVGTEYGKFDESDICDELAGNIDGLPNVEDGILLIVSAITLKAAKASGRTDCIAPATGHPDTLRTHKGHIVSVPGFVR